MTIDSSLLNSSIEVYAHPTKAPDDYADVPKL